MGEIADMMLEGTLCCQCGQTLDERVIDLDMGIPVICDSCYEELSHRDKLDYRFRHESYFINN
jgi:hypothetical protein